ncbi:MAG: hypothetical protein L0387_01240 [Acidobacteria bacterium]|nr:hypothetical protein [Acidobacteriota bacterium]
MKINVKIDTKALKATTQREARRLAFSTAQALNETAKEVQTAERVQLDRTFQVRKAGFIYRLIKITSWASARQGRPYAEVAVDNTKKRVLLSTFEEGGVKEPAKGKHVAVPITGEAARPSFASTIEEGLTFKGMKFRKHVTKRGKVQWKGRRGTFIIPDLGVLQRTAGKAKSSIARVIYSFQNRPKLKAVLNFVETARATFDRQWERQFRRAYRR